MNKNELFDKSQIIFTKTTKMNDLTQVIFTMGKNIRICASIPSNEKAQTDLCFTKTIARLSAIVQIRPEEFLTKFPQVEKEREFLRRVCITNLCSGRGYYIDGQDKYFSELIVGKYPDIRAECEKFEGYMHVILKQAQDLAMETKYDEAKTIFSKYEHISEVAFAIAILDFVQNERPAVLNLEDEYVDVMHDLWNAKTAEDFVNAIINNAEVTSDAWIVSMLLRARQRFPSNSEISFHTHGESCEVTGEFSFTCGSSKNSAKDETI